MSEMGGMKPPGNFNPVGLEVATSWQKWSEQFDFYMKATEKDTKGSDVQVAILLTLLGAEAMDIYRSFEWVTAADKDDIEIVKAKFKAYFTPRVNETYERYKFLKRKQEQGETFESFLTDLKNLVSSCGYHVEEKSKVLRDQIVMGVVSNVVREKLLDQAALTLNTAVDLCRSSEVTGQLMMGMSATNDPIQPVHAVKQKGHRSTHTNRSDKHVHKNNHKCCKYCGKSHEPRKCQAYGRFCNKCGMKNHYANCCDNFSKNDNKTPVHSVEHNNDNTHSIVFSVIEQSTSKEWHAVLDIGGRGLRAKIDTGASCNVISINDYKILSKAQPAQCIKCRTKLMSYGGHNLSVKGQVTYTAEYKQKYYPIEFVVVEEKAPALLGLETCIELGLVKRVNQVEKEESVLDEFKDVFQGLGRLKQKHSIRLKPECEPVIHPARRVPYRLQEQFDKTLSDMESNKIITKVTEPTEWVNPIVTVRKPSGALRICLDPLELNKAIRWEHYSIPTPGEIVAKLHGSKYFSTLDATSGFLQIPLDDASSYVTTFATPSGRYRFLRLSFGIKSAPEVFHRTIVEMFHDIEGVETYIDDILIYAPTEEEHDRRLRAVLQRCRDANLSLNKDKCVIKTQELKYLGHIISPDGVKADPAKVVAIVDMPVPESKEDVRRFIGLINYVSKYCPNLSSIAAPLRDLTKKDVVWSWDSNHQQAWLAVKGLIKANVELKLFDPTKPVVVTVDASQRGIGAALLQQGEPIEFASCSMTETQQRYAQIEKEFLAIQFGLKRFHQYVYGQRVVVETDHMPLLGIIKKPISQISPRLQRMRLRIDPYDYELVYRPGSELVLAELCELTAQDESLQLIVAWYVRKGWPEHKKLCPDLIKPYWNVRHELSEHEGMLFRGEQIVVPYAYQKRALTCLHTGHLGIVKCTERAKTTLYWPGYVRDIQEMVERCSRCQANRNVSAHEPLIPTPVPEYPFQKVGADLFTLDGVTYLLTVDYYSKWLSIAPLHDTKSIDVIRELKRIFADFGSPEILVTDGGPQFGSHEFRRFASDWLVQHTMSSPAYPRSNGQAERMVQTAKNLLRKCSQDNTDYQQGLLALRDTPIANNLPSPAELLQGRRLRGNLPIVTVAKRFPKGYNRKLVRDNFETRATTTKAYHDRKAGNAKPVLKPGDRVRARIQGSWTPAMIIDLSDKPRSYIIRMNNGTEMRRNNHDLRLSREEIVSNEPSHNTRRASQEMTVTVDPPPEPAISVPNSQSVEFTPPVENSTPYITRSGRECKKPARFMD